MPNAITIRFINTKSSSLSTITSGEVLANDISAIVGVLIFLTIGGVEFRSSDINMPNIVSLTSRRKFWGAQFHTGSNFFLITFEQGVDFSWSEFHGKTFFGSNINDKLISIM